MNVVFRDPPGRDFLIIPKNERAAFFRNVLQRIGESRYLKDFMLRDSGKYVQKKADGINHVIVMQRFWRYGSLDFDVILCIYFDQAMRVVYECMKPYKINNKYYSQPMNLIGLHELSKICGVSDGTRYNFIYEGDDISVVERIKYDLDSVADKFFYRQDSLSNLISTYESSEKDRSCGIWRNDPFQMAVLYYVAGRKEDCRCFLESWGDAGSLKEILVYFRECMLQKLEALA